MNWRSVRTRLVLLTIGFALMVWGFQTLLFTQAPDVFNDPLEDLSFGWYVPIFSLYVIWTERRKIVDSFGSSSVVGFLMMLPCLFVGFLGVRGIQVRFEMLSFIGLLVTVPWAFFGFKTAKRLVFPAGFLLFCIPLASYLDVITVHLRLLATSLASGLLQVIGAGIVRTGTMLAASDGSFAIDIAEPCSGLRSIFALTALTAAYAYFNQPTWLRRACLFACSIPLAIFGNVMRILTICLVGSFASPDFATGFYHDYSGYIVFIAAIALMVGCGELVTWLAARFAKGEARPSEKSVEASEQRTRGRNILVPILSLLVMLAAFTAFVNTPETVLCDPPAVALGELAGYASQTQEVSEAELKTLPADTRFDKRVYTRPNGEWYAVTLVFGGKSKSSIHRPELCLPCQGYLMTDPHTLEVGDIAWRYIRLDGGVDRPSLGFTYTFFNQAGFRTSSHVQRILRDVWDRSFFNRIDRWVMVTVNSSVADERRLSEFLRQLEEVIR